MRTYIDIVEHQHKSVLMEGLLLEYHDYGANKLAPSFSLLYEQLSKKEATDRLLTQLLAHHGNNVQAVVDSVKTHKGKTTTKPPVTVTEPKDLVADPSLRWSQDQKSGITSLKNALQQLPKLAQKADQLVDDPSAFIDRKTKEIQDKIDQKIDPNSKFASYKTQLKNFVAKLAELSKTHPKKTSIIVAAVGVIGGLLTAGGPWVGGAITAIIKLILMLIQGRSLGEAVKEILKSTSLSILLGYGIGAAFTTISGLFSSVEAVASPASSSQVAQSSAASIPDAQPVVSNAYVEQLRPLVDPTGEGVGIPTMNQPTFGRAFRAARDAMGSGNMFVWNGNVYTTNTEQEGLLRGINDAAKRYLRGVR